MVIYGHLNKGKKKLMFMVLIKRIMNNEKYNALKSFCEVWIIAVGLWSILNVMWFSSYHEIQQLLQKKWHNIKGYCQIKHHLSIASMCIYSHNKHKSKILAYTDFCVSEVCTIMLIAHAPLTSMLKILSDPYNW